MRPITIIRVTQMRDGKVEVVLPGRRCFVFRSMRQMQERASLAEELIPEDCIVARLLLAGNTLAEGVGEYNVELFAERS